MAKCDICGEDIPGRGLYKHRWSAHHDEALRIREAGRSQKKAKSNGHASEQKTAKTTDKIANIVAPAPGAVVFRLGQRNIELDPGELFECYLLCMDMKQHFGLNDPFSTILKDCVNIAYRNSMARVVVYDGGVTIVKSDGKEDFEEVPDG
mgnify:CR=1 FL=1